jgi:predicted nuclease with TOPRIM domain
MRGSEAQRLNLDDQVNENHMEARIAKLESDVEYIKKDLGQLRIDMNAANGSLAILKDDVSQLKAIAPHLATRADLHKLETLIVAQDAKLETLMVAQDAKLETLIVAQEAKFFRWFVRAVLAVAALAFSIARFVL